MGEFKWRSNVFAMIGTTSLDTELRKECLDYNPSIKKLEGVPPIVDIDFMLIFISLLTILFVALAGVGIYHLYDIYIHIYPDHLYTHQRYVETYHLLKLIRAYPADWYI